MTRDEAIEQLDWYFNNDGITADGRTHSAYTTLRAIAYSYDGCGTKDKSSHGICPTCGSVTSWNSYFGRYICSNCGWEGKAI